MDDRRTLAWPGSYNARDLGGLPTATGGTTRPGSIVRCESPDFFEPSAWPQIERFGIRTCVDLRSSWEVEAGPYSPPPSVTRVPAPLEEGLLADLDVPALLRHAGATATEVDQLRARLTG